MKRLNDFLLELDISDENLDGLLLSNSDFINERVSFIESEINENSDAAQRELHCSLYRIYLHWFKAPWKLGNLDSNNTKIIEMRRKLERIWDDSLNSYYSEFLSEIPEEINEFFDWAKNIVNIHESGITHPVFSFLKEEANDIQLLEFIRQESPFDLHFSDILSYLIPGIYGSPRIEMADNFWDEMGNGKQKRTHHYLRVELMNKLNLDVEECYLPERFCWEQIALANIYFKNALNRKTIPLVLGSMLSTEMAVPGRMNFVYLGMRRLGYAREELDYITEHMVVDIKHAQGWQENVIKPLLIQSPRLKEDITKGVLLRLKYANLVCDRMFDHLQLCEYSSVKTYDSLR